MTWKDVTIEKFIALMNVIDKEFSDPELKAFSILSILHDKPAEYFESSISVKELSKLISESQFIYSTDKANGVPPTLKVNGKRYNVELNMSEITNGQFMDLTKYISSKESINNNYHKIIATLISPRDIFGRDKFNRMLSKGKTTDELIVIHDKIFKERQLIAEEFKKHLTMDKAFQLSQYFFLLLENLNKGTQTYLEKQLKKRMKEASRVLSQTDFDLIGDGL